MPEDYQNRIDRLEERLEQIVILQGRIDENTQTALAQDEENREPAINTMRRAGRARGRGSAVDRPRNEFSDCVDWRV